MTVEGINKIGITIPETTPKVFKASALLAPAFTSMAGNSTATAEETSAPLARTDVIGRLAAKRGCKEPLGLPIFPFLTKNQTKERLQEKI